MDALERAEALIKSAYESQDIEGYRATIAEATAVAAIAQAEQLKRIGDLFEGWLKVQGVLPEYFEAVNRIRLYEDRIYELEEMMRPDDDGREAIQPGDYRYFTGNTVPQEPEF